MFMCICADGKKEDGAVQAALRSRMTHLHFRRGMDYKQYLSTWRIAS